MRSPATEAHLPDAGRGAAPDAVADPEQDVATVFEGVADRSPDRVALSADGRQVTFAELLDASGRLAAALLDRRTGERPDRVALLIEDRRLAVAGIVGALRAGAAFVPLDAGHPRERLLQCARDADPSVIVAEAATAPLARSLADALPGRPPVVTLDDAGARHGPVGPVGPLRPHGPLGRPPVAPGDAAYILYTSGSTGEPRGVVQSHRNVLHNVAKYGGSLRLGPGDRHSLLGSYAFAASMTDLFGALLCGAALCPFDVRRGGLARLAGWLDQERVTVLFLVPTLFRHFTALLDDGRRFPGVRVVKLGGEPVLARDHEQFVRVFERPCRFLNSYGATEINTIRQMFMDHDSRPDGGVLPVGYAVPETEVLVLDERGQAVPAGQPGEIHVASRFLSPGYWRAPELTRARFLPHPDGGPRRLLRTGDLGRLADDGCLHHLGRNDQQVRIRGHRVEAAEVEAALLRHPRIAEAAVVPHIDVRGETQLVAHVVARGSRVPDGADLRARLARTLPDYMLPSHVAFRASLPLLPAGKVDRAALSRQPVAARPARAAGESAPRDRREKDLVAVWERILHVRGIGRDDDFFELGGHSLLAARIVARLHDTTGIALPLTALAESPTVARLADRLRLARAPARERSAAPEGGDPLAASLERRVVPLLGGAPGGTPLYCVPAAGADVFSLRDLALRLAPRRSVVGLQMPGLDGRRMPLESVDEIAADLQAELLAAAPAGPYLLAGCSFGGLVAVELARRLRALGHDVPLVVLLDARAPGYPRPRPGAGPPARLRRVLRQLQPLGSRHTFSWAGVRRGLRQRVEHLQYRAFCIARRLTGRPARPPFALRHAFVREACLRALARHRPDRVDVPLLLLRAEQQPPADLFVTDPALGWMALGAGTIEVATVPGAHDTMLREPHVAQLAAELDAALSPRAGPSRR